MTANHAHTPKALSTEFVRDMFEIAAVYTGHSESMEAATPHFNRWLATIEAAAEQRGAARGKIEGLREAATIIRDSKFANSVKPPSKKVQVKEADWLDALADRLEGDDAG